MRKRGGGGGGGGEQDKEERWRGGRGNMIVKRWKE